MSKPIVWVIKEQVRRDATGAVPMDYTPAFKFGVVRFITDFDIPLYSRQGSGVAIQWFSKVVAFSKELDDDNDYIIMTGSPLAIFMVGAILSTCNKLPKILVWRRETSEYIIYDPMPALNTMVEVGEINAIVQ